MPSTTAALGPTPVRQDFSFDQRAAIALFRGAGGLLIPSAAGPQAIGVDTLNTRLAETFPDYFLTSQAFDSFEGNIFAFEEVGSQQAQSFFSQFPTPASLAIVGYSGGGLSAIRLANAQSPRPVNLLVQIDSYVPLTDASSEDNVLPANVLRGINYYQIRNRANPTEPGFDLLDLQGGQVVEGSENINAEELFSDRTITHRNIAEYAPLQERILQNIEESALSGLTFDPLEQIRLTGGATPVNNFLRLAPSTGNVPTRAFLAETFAVDPNFSFQSRFEFRLPPVPNALSGLAFQVEPTVAGSTPSLALTFDPIAPNTVSLIAEGAAPTPLVQATAPLELASGRPLTAWIDYNGFTDQLSFFLSNTPTRPSAPLLSYAVDLLALVGPQAQFGYTTRVNGTERSADLLSWQLSTTETNAGTPTTTFFNFDLTQRAAAAWFGVELPAIPSTVGGLDFTALFDEALYQRQNPDVLAALNTGLFFSGYDHFIQFGWLEGRNPSSVYDETFYLATQADVAQAVALEIGRAALSTLSARDISRAAILARYSARALTSPSIPTWLM
ncbi:MAG: hypothetical protein ICV77_13955, partial [Cyanobacteria bacterium Co-bin8]|nr:hypothetical protein [Cyanobacteria bacterium Co-bin8]